MITKPHSNICLGSWEQCCLMMDRSGICGLHLWKRCQNWLLDDRHNHHATIPAEQQSIRNMGQAILTTSGEHFNGIKRRITSLRCYLSVKLAWETVRRRSWLSHGMFILSLNTHGERNTQGARHCRSGPRGQLAITDGRTCLVPTRGKSERFLCIQRSAAGLVKNFFFFNIICTNLLLKPEFLGICWQKHDR